MEQGLLLLVLLVLEGSGHDWGHTARFTLSLSLSLSISRNLGLLYLALLQLLWSVHHVTVSFISFLGLIWINHIFFCFSFNKLLFFLLLVINLKYDLNDYCIT